MANDEDVEMTDAGRRVMRQALRSEAASVTVYDGNGNDLFTINTSEAIDGVFDAADGVL